MTTPNEPNKLETQQTDPQLDALLDRAVSAGSPQVSPDLTQRILDQTQPMLGQQPVIAKIGPTLLRIAAAVAIIVGAGVAAVVLTNNQAAPDNPDTFVEADPGLPAPDLLPTDVAIDTGNTRIDERLDVLSLRVELASAEELWTSVDTDTNSLMDQAVTAYELDQFSEDAAYLWADDSVLF